MWHAASIYEDGNPRLNNGDHRGILEGESLYVDCIPVVAKVGLHASASILDAIFYSTDFGSGIAICAVELDGKTDESEHQSCAQTRKCLKIFDDKTTRRAIRESAYEIIKNMSMVSVSLADIIKCGDPLWSDTNSVLDRYGEIAAIGENVGPGYINASIAIENIRNCVTEFGGHRIATKNLMRKIFEYILTVHLVCLTMDIDKTGIMGFQTRGRIDELAGLTQEKLLGIYKLGEAKGE